MRHKSRGYFPILSSAVVFEIERPSIAGKKKAMTAPAVAPTNCRGIQIDFAEIATTYTAHRLPNVRRRYCGWVSVISLSRDITLSRLSRYGSICMGKLARTDNKKLILTRILIPWAHLGDIIAFKFLRMTQIIPVSGKVSCISFLFLSYVLNCECFQNISGYILSK